MPRSHTFKSADDYEEYLEEKAEERRNYGTVVANCESCGDHFRKSEDSQVKNCPPDEAFRVAVDDLGIAFDTAFAEELRAGRISGVDFTVADIERIRRSVEQPQVKRTPAASETRFYSEMDLVADRGR